MWVEPRPGHTAIVIVMQIPLDRPHVALCLLFQHFPIPPTIIPEEFHTVEQLPLPPIMSAGNVLPTSAGIISGMTAFPMPGVGSPSMPAIFVYDGIVVIITSIGRLEQTV